MAAPVKRVEGSKEQGALTLIDATSGAGALNDSAVMAMYQFYGFQAQFPSALLSFPREGTAKLWSLIDQYGGGAYRQDANYAYSQFSQELQLVGSSPEVMVRVEDRTITVRPIAGTRRRGEARGPLREGKARQGRARVLGRTRHHGNHSVAQGKLRL